MKRQVFFSFHYQADAWVINEIRNMGVIEGDQKISPNDWEEVKRKGDSTVRNWIDSQLAKRSCTVVLIGKETANRKWVKYEIEKSLELKKGIFGIYIHNLKDQNEKQTSKGANPLLKFGNAIKTYDPPHSDSKMVYDYIEGNLASWIEEAIKNRPS